MIGRIGTLNNNSKNSYLRRLLLPSFGEAIFFNPNLFVRLLTSQLLSQGLNTLKVDFLARM